MVSIAHSREVGDVPNVRAIGGRVRCGVVRIDRTGADAAMVSIVGCSGRMFMLCGHWGRRLHKEQFLRVVARSDRRGVRSIDGIVVRVLPATVFAALAARRAVRVG